MKNNNNKKMPKSGKLVAPLNTEIVEESFLHEKRDKNNPNKYPVSSFSFRQGALWFKSRVVGYYQQNQ